MRSMTDEGDAIAAILNRCDFMPSALTRPAPRATLSRQRGRGARYPTSTMRTSFTLVSVGSVTTRSPLASNIS